MTAYLAPCLDRLRDEVDFTHRNRDRTSDGWIGDPAHAARVSDHNPDEEADDVVRAVDIDHDGVDKHVVRQRAIADPRTEYVIQDGHIYRRATGFKKEKYNGANGHYGHTHISCRHGKQFEDNRGNWGYADVVLGRLSPAPAPAPAPAAPAPSSDLEAIGRFFDDLAREVIAGKWGNGPERSRRLQAAGYSPSVVQERVNAILGTNKPAAVRPSVQVLADQVIQGQWGSGLERRRRLAAAGYDYAAIQAEVNRRVRR